MSENINLIIQIIAAGGVIVSVVYLAIQINQQNKITRAQFGHTLTQRQYDRYFAPQEMVNSVNSYLKIGLVILMTKIG